MQRADLVAALDIGVTDFDATIVAADDAEGSRTLDYLESRL